MRLGGLESRTESDDMRVLENEEEIRHAPGSALLHERALHVMRRGVSDGAEATNLERTQSYSQFSIIAFTCCMNRSATAPSTMRWS